MKKLFFLFALTMYALVTMSFTTKSDEQKNELNAPETEAFVVSTGANGEITNIISPESQYIAMQAWGIKDLSGPTNVRNAPKGKVCMKLKAWTRYVIYTTGIRNGWLRINSIYNDTEGYWVRLHGSETGYWIAKSILYHIDDVAE